MRPTSRTPVAGGGRGLFGIRPAPPLSKRYSLGKSEAPCDPPLPVDTHPPPSSPGGWSLVLSPATSEGTEGHVGPEAYQVTQRV